MGFFDFGKKRRKTVRRSVKKVRKPPAALLRKCRKYRIKTTVRKGGKRVYRKVSLLKKLLKRKIKRIKKSKKVTRRTRRSGFGGKKKMTLEECKRRHPMLVLNKKGTECQFPDATKDECIRQNREWDPDSKTCLGPNEIVNGEPFFDPNNPGLEFTVEKDNNGKVSRIKSGDKYISYNLLVEKRYINPFADRMRDENKKEYAIKRNGLETDVWIDGKWVDYKTALKNNLIKELKTSIVQFGRRRSRFGEGSVEGSVTCDGIEQGSTGYVKCVVNKYNKMVDSLDLQLPDGTSFGGIHLDSLKLQGMALYKRASIDKTKLSIYKKQAKDGLKAALQAGLVTGQIAGNLTFTVLKSLGDYALIIAATGGNVLTGLGSVLSAFR